MHNRGFIIAVSLAVGAAMLVGMTASGAGAAGAKTAATGNGWKPSVAETADLEPPVAVDPIYAAFDAGKYQETKTLAEAAAAKGDAAAHTLLGQMYEQGLGVPQDFGKAAQWFTKGATLGDVHSQFALGVLLAEGRGIKENKKQSADFFELAASKNHAIALYNLGLVYAHGEARPQDFKKAAELMEASAKLDYGPAQYDLAGFYKDGPIEMRDEAKMVYWLGRAAEGGHANAELEYGIALFNGKGVPKNQKAGLIFILRAAEKGNPIAQNRLANAFAAGAGTKSDVIEASKWHLLARQAGVSDLRLDKLLGVLTEEQRAKADRAALEWEHSLAALLQ